MKFLIDNAVSFKVADRLRKEGYDVIHVREVNLQKASDSEIFKFALKEERTIISADTDFSHFLFKWKKNKPSLILFRKGYHKPDVQAEILIKNLPFLKDKIEKGCVLIFEKERIRLRNLPI
ncbi:MAG TPA: DUF5615 family PIN-like protein [bacterium]|nr:DUF5615 family PIN-like protein [bacterium]HOL66067.1 DUF5615 family PIN-like protein [bacterium]HPP11412.1 DUF5615 family PIN-like protein [bacterium]